MRRILILLSLSLVLVLTLPGVAMAAAVVKATNSNNWNPTTKNVNQGVKVIWKNPSNADHTVTSTSSNWNKDVYLDPGERTSKTFQSNGTYRYKCTRHNGMSGKIVVG